MSKTRCIQQFGIAFALVFVSAHLYAQPGTSIPQFFASNWLGWNTGYADAPAPFEDGGRLPEALALGDLDGDGITDAVVSHSSQDAPGVSLLRGVGGGIFAAPVHLSTAFSESIMDVELHDFDDDGDLDIFATQFGNFGNGAEVVLWRNDGSGSFPAREDLAVGSGPLEIEFADVSDDDVEDMIVTNNGFLGDGASISVRIHNGSSGSAAGFAAAISSPALVGAHGLAVADMDGDGLRDVVVSGDQLRRMAIGFNQGGGIFSAPGVEYSLDFGGSFTSSTLAAADFDNDGDTDVSTSSEGNLLIWRNDGNGVLSQSPDDVFPFASPDPLDPGVVFMAANAYRQKAIDVNQDGWIDILTANSNGRAAESINVILNDGNGDFIDPVAYHGSQNTKDVDAADVDADGDLDILTVAQFSNVLTVHKNDGQAGFRGIDHPTAVDPLAEQLAAGDLDRDGDIDLVSISLGATIATNQGNGSLDPITTNIDTPIDGKDALLVDLNGDEYPDLVLGPDEDSPPYFAAVMLNDGMGNLLPGSVVVPTPGGTCGTGTLAAGDFDGDGDIDIALNEEQACFGDLFGDMFILFNDGAGNLTGSLAFEDNGVYFGLEAHDFNQDGALDLISTKAELGVTFRVYPGDGNGGFGAPITSTGSIAPQRFFLGAFKVADFNGDGLLDAASLLETQGFSSSNLVGIYLGQGDGTFAASPVNIVPGSSTNESLRVGLDVDAVDADLDGDLDVVVTNFASNDHSIFLNDGAGFLTVAGRSGANLQPLETVVADIDGNGSSDLATLVSRPNVGSGIILLKNLGMTDTLFADGFEGSLD